MGRLSGPRIAHLLRLAQVGRIDPTHRVGDPHRVPSGRPSAPIRIFHTSCDRVSADSSQASQRPPGENFGDDRIPVWGFEMSDSTSPVASADASAISLLIPAPVARTNAGRPSPRHPCARTRPACVRRATRKRRDRPPGPRAEPVESLLLSPDGRALYYVSATRVPGTAPSRGASSASTRTPTFSADCRARRGATADPISAVRASTTRISSVVWPGCAVCSNGAARRWRWNRNSPVRSEISCAGMPSIGPRRWGPATSARGSSAPCSARDSGSRPTPISPR